MNQQYNTQSSMQNEIGNLEANNSNNNNNGYPIDEFPNLIQPINDFQYIDANGNIVKGVPAFVSPDGRQIILKDIDPISGIGEAIVTPPPQQQQQPPSAHLVTSPTPQSFIVQHHMAPSAVSVSANSTLARTSSSNQNAGHGMRVTSSSSNLASAQQQQQQQQKQSFINNKANSIEVTNNISADARRVSTNNSNSSGIIVYY